MGRTIVVVVALAVVGSACSSGGESSPDEAPPPATGIVLPELPVGTAGLLPEGSWVLAESSVDGAALPSLRGLRATFHVDGASVDGAANCVGYTGVTRPDDDGIELVVVRSPLTVGCGPSEAVQDALIESLGRVEEHEVIDGHLVLRGPDVLLRLAPMTPIPPEVFDRDWTLVEWLPTLRDELVPAVAPSTLRLHADGRFEGTSGCDQEISGIWERHDDGLRMPIFDITAPCSDPDPMVVDQHGFVTMMGIGVRPVLTDDGRMDVVMGLGASDRVVLVYG